MTNLHPREVDLSTSPLRPTNLLTFHLSWLGFGLLGFSHLCVMFKRTWDPHCNHILLNACSCHIFSHR
jgi:hypothetical protein